MSRDPEVQQARLRLIKQCDDTIAFVRRTYGTEVAHPNLPVTPRIGVTMNLPARRMSAAAVRQLVDNGSLTLGRRRRRSWQQRLRRWLP